MSIQRRIIVSGLIIAGICVIVNPAGVSAADPVAQYCGKKPSPNCREFVALVNWLVSTGKVRTDYNDRRASILKLPTGAFAKARGSTGAATDENPSRVCSLVFDKDPSQPKARPVCLVIQTIIIDPAARKHKDTFYRLKLDGNPDMAYDAEGKLDERGEAVAGSAEFQKLSTKKAEIKAKIQQELAFWIKRANDTTVSVAAPAEQPSK